jgi:hypothetical protein
MDVRGEGTGAADVAMAGLVEILKAFAEDPTPGLGILAQSGECRMLS